MSNTVDFIADTVKQQAIILKQIATDVAEMKIAINDLRENNTMSAQMAEKMYRALNIKFDMLENLNVKSNAAIQQSATTRTVKQSRPIYFKTIFNEDRDKYMGVLYTQEDIDTVMNDDQVKTKTGTVQSNRIANILYNKFVKEQPTRKQAFEEIYTKHFS